MLQGIQLILLGAVLADASGGESAVARRPDRSQPFAPNELLGISIFARQSGSCESGYKTCSSACILSTSECCDALGSCPRGYYCDSIGCCEDGRTCTGISDECTRDSKRCGDDCIPESETCTDGSTGPPSSGDASGSSCSAFEEPCGNRCMTAGSDCCSGGLTFCAAGFVCTPDNQCSLDRGPAASSSASTSSTASRTTAFSASTFTPTRTNTLPTASSTSDSSSDGICSPLEDQCGYNCMPAGSTCCASGYCGAGELCSESNRCRIPGEPAVDAGPYSALRTPTSSSVTGGGSSDSSTSGSSSRVASFRPAPLGTAVAGFMVVLGFLLISFQ